jgi:hypothetical protein
MIDFTPIERTKTNFVTLENSRTDLIHIKNT